MRWILKQILFHLVALLLTKYIIKGFRIGNSYEAIALATVALAIINVFVKPIVKIFFFPLNLLTLNLFSVVINIGVVYALTKLVPTVTISSWHFNGLNVNGFIVPAIQFTIFYTYIIVGILITSIVNFLRWLTK